MDHKLRIIFMGTPEFAVPSLKILVENDYEIVAVVTAADKPAGRGQKMQESAVKKFASLYGLKILQPEKLKDPDFIQTLKQLKPELQVVVAFRMLPEIVWSLPTYGTINLHASLLPHYRGAAPINWVIINGEKETGLTTFFLQQEIDTGKIIDQKKIAIKDSDTAGDLHDRLMQEGSELLLKTVQSIEAGSTAPIDQKVLTYSELKTAPKIFRENCQIHWNSDGIKIQNLIRGLSPYPGAWCSLQNEMGNSFVLKIYATEFSEEVHNKKSGEIISDERTYLRIAVLDGYISLLSVQIEGKKRMNIDEFLRGHQHILKFSFINPL
jgi:methionyl-tRNA formyltransferase